MEMHLEGILHVHVCYTFLHPSEPSNLVSLLKSSQDKLSFDMHI